MRSSGSGERRGRGGEADRPGLVPREVTWLHKSTYPDRTRDSTATLLPLRFGDLTGLRAQFCWSCLGVSHVSAVRRRLGQVLRRLQGEPGHLAPPFLPDSWPLLSQGLSPRLSRGILGSPKCSEREEAEDTSLPQVQAGTGALPPAFHPGHLQDWLTQVVSTLQGYCED